MYCALYFLFYFYWPEQRNVKMLACVFPHSDHLISNNCLNPEKEIPLLSFLFFHMMRNPPEERAGICGKHLTSEQIVG